MMFGVKDFVPPSLGREGRPRSPQHLHTGAPNRIKRHLIQALRRVGSREPIGKVVDDLARSRQDDGVSIRDVQIK
jgi:hypothetical protein